MEFDISLAFITAITIGIVEGAKNVGLSTRLSPVFALIAALGLAFLAFPIEQIGLRTIILNGLLAGLTSQGLYAGIKKTVGK